MIALKTILREIDPFAFEEALKLTPQQKKLYSVKQEDTDRKGFDKRGDKLDTKLKQNDTAYTEPLMPFKKEALIKDFNELYAKIYDKEKYVNL